MRNTYAGVCYRCGKLVPPGEGHFERFRKEHRKKHPDAPRTVNWLTQHASCAISYRGTAKSIWKNLETGSHGVGI